MEWRVAYIVGISHKKRSLTVRMLNERNELKREKVLSWPAALNDGLVKKFISSEYVQILPPGSENNKSLLR